MCHFCVFCCVYVCVFACVYMFVCLCQSVVSNVSVMENIKYVLFYVCVFLNLQILLSHPVYVCEF